MAQRNGTEGPPHEKRMRTNGDEAASHGGGGSAPAFATGMPPSAARTRPTNGGAATTGGGADGAGPARLPPQQQQQQEPPFAQPILPPGLFMPAIEAGAHQVCRPSTLVFAGGCPDVSVSCADPLGAYLRLSARGR